MPSKLAAPSAEPYDLSEFGVRYSSSCWPLRHEVMEGSVELLKLDFLTVPTGWRDTLKSYSASTLLGLTTRPTAVALTLRERFYTLREFARWCAHQGAESPLEVDAALILTWGKLLYDIKSTKRYSAKVIAKKAANVEELLRDNVGCGEDVRAACSAVAHRARKIVSIHPVGAATAALDEELVLSYLSDAIVVVTQDASKVIELRKRLHPLRHKGRIKKRSGKGWHVETAERCEKFASKALSRLGDGIAYSEENMVALVTGAALLVIALLSVMRSSELRRLRVGCIQNDPSRSGSSWLISGRLSKSMREHRWVVVPEVKAAVEVLERIGRETRERSGTEALLTTGLLSRRPYLSRTEGGVATSQQIVDRIREFATACRPERSGDASLLSIRSTRRFLARFVARRDRTTLGLLALQYGHLDAQITDTYYVGSDPELAKLLETESEIEIANAMSDLVNSPAVYSKLPTEILDDSRARMRGLLERASTEVGVLRMLGSGVILGPCDWGYCFYREKRSKCDGDASGPNPSNRTPATCADCLNFTATANHREWWSRRVADLEEFCRLRGIPEQAALISADRLRTARQVLASLGAVNED